MSFKPEFEVYGEEGKFYSNGQNFATYEEAEKSAINRSFNWMLVKNYRVAEVSDEEFPVNYKWDEEKGDTRLNDEYFIKTLEKKGSV